MKKKLFFAPFLLFAIAAVHAQIITKPEKKPVTKVLTPAPPPPPPSTNKSTTNPTQNSPVYSLTSVRVLLKTGIDNKEFPSSVKVYVWKKGTQLGDYTNNCLYSVHDLKNEMAVNSVTEIGLEKYQGNSDKFSLVNLQVTGLEIRVSYETNFFMDAWKVENISLLLEFKDQYGNLHPTMGSKTISFSNAIGFLNSEYTYFKCTTDQNFNPLTASIEKR